MKTKPGHMTLEQHFANLAKDAQWQGRFDAIASASGVAEDVREMSIALPTIDERIKSAETNAYRAGVKACIDLANSCTSRLSRKQFEPV